MNTLACPLLDAAATTTVMVNTGNRNKLKKKTMFHTIFVNKTEPSLFESLEQHIDAMCGGCHGEFFVPNSNQNIGFEYRFVEIRNSDVLQLVKLKQDIHLGEETTYT